MILNNMEIDFREYKTTDRNILASWIRDASNNVKDALDGYMSQLSEIIAADKSKVVIATHNDIPVGFAASKINNNETGILSLLFVTPSYRGNRLGKELLDLVENYCKDQKCDSIVVYNRLAITIDGYLADKGYSKNEELLSKKLIRG